MKNKKGFTLIELIAVIAIIALISLIAIPNIVGLSTGVKKDNMLDDAKKLISLAKLRVSQNSELRKTSQTFSFNVLNEKGDIEKDPDGGDYVAADSYVKYNVVRDGSNVIKATYCVVLKGSKRMIGSSTNCIDETELY